MTREEAKLEFFTLLESGIIDFKEKNIIDKIYDSFEKRSCDNCKYILDTKTIGNFCEYNDRCSDEGISVDYVRDIKDFSCNKWEKNES